MKPAKLRPGLYRYRTRIIRLTRRTFWTIEGVSLQKFKTVEDAAQYIDRFLVYSWPQSG